MVRGRAALRRRNRKTGGGLLTAVVVLLAAGACLLAKPPEPAALVSVFAHGTPGPSAAPAVDTVTLRAQSWYVVETGGQAVAAERALLTAEVVREGYGDPADVRHVSVEAVALRITASGAQVDALRRSADALYAAFAALEAMARMEPAAAAREARLRGAELDALVASLDTALAGTENPVVRGLAGLVGSCRETMRGISENADAQAVQRATASLVLQYEAFVQYLTQRGQ
ncbi:hypothetical protein FACS1894196_2280 [Clostridia bacterium]|nr:hypothetical protein FACS1894196_2280 [Clostridia bacterium]